MNHFNPVTPYNNLPGLPPKKEIETKKILKKCIEARSSLAELKVAGKLIPNQAVLINTIPLLEAKDSSEIENIVTTTDKLFKFAYDQIHQAPDASTKEALRYRTALLKGHQSLSKKPLSISTAIEVCSEIKGRIMEIRKVPGTALANDQSKNIIYTPPEGEKVIYEKLSNLENFLHYESDIDPLIRMAIGHYQFEAIHPFSDGNGRTGRIINLLYLISEGLLHQPILYLSKFILSNKKDYYRLLLNVTKDNDWEPWILFILQGIKETSFWTSKKVESVRRLIEHTGELMAKKLPKIYSYELLEILFTQPYCRINNLIENNIAKRETASNYLKRLAEIGILEEIKAGRDKIFLHPKFLRLLTNNDHMFEKYI